MQGQARLRHSFREFLFRGGRRARTTVRRARGRPGAAAVEPLVHLPWIGRAPGPRTITLMPPTRLARPSRVGFDLRGAAVGRRVSHHLCGVASRFATAHRSRRVELNPGDAADTTSARRSGSLPLSHGRGHWKSGQKMAKPSGLLREIGQKCLKRRRMRCRRVHLYSTGPRRPQGDLWGRY